MKKKQPNHPMFYEPDTQLNGIILMSSSLRGAETSGFYLRDNAACINTHLHILPRHTHRVRGKMMHYKNGGRWKVSVPVHSTVHLPESSTAATKNRDVSVDSHSFHSYYEWTLGCSCVSVCVCVCRRLLLHAVHQPEPVHRVGMKSTVLLQPHVGPTCTCADPGVSEMLTKMCAED